MTKLSTQTPEVMLTRLIKRLLELRGACGYLDTQVLDAPLTDIIRKFMISKLLHDNFVVAIAGEQGSGKTTFLKEIYDLDDTWLIGNEGRGEHSPVLILEDDQIKQPRGVLSELVELTTGFEIIDRKVDDEIFKNALKNSVAGQMIPKLYVPRRYFEGSNQGFLLLPGYEKINHENRSWQELMRQTLIASATCVVVTDKTRMANNQQESILHDMQRQQLSGAKPIVVITKTENEPDDKYLIGLRQTAAGVFEIPEAESSARVICSGAGLKYRDKWLPVFKGSLERFSIISSAARSKQLDDLKEILHNELLDVLMKVDDEKRAKSIGSGAQDADVEKTLERFDKATKKLRKELASELDESLSQYSKNSAARGVGFHIDKNEGWINLLKRPIRFVANSVSSGDHEKNQKSLIEKAWNPNQNEQGFASSYLEAIGKVTARQLNFSLLPAKASSTKDKQKLLGYIGVDNAPITVGALDQEKLDNLNALFDSKREGDKRLTKEAQQTVDLIPVLALEFTRIAAIFPAAVGVESNSLRQNNGGLIGAAERIEKDFGFLKGTHSNIIKGIAAILAVDVAADGKIDTIPALIGVFTGGQATGGAAMTTAATVANAVAATVAIGMLTVCVLNEIHRGDTEQRDMIRRAIYAIRDSHREHYLSHFDDIMDHLRSALEKCLTIRYRLDEEFMRMDRLKKALVDVRSIRTDMLEIIGDAAPTLG